MRELSLHILDIVTNSIEAGATRIVVGIDEIVAKNLLILKIKDNGRGMAQEMIEKVIDPFVTTRTTRKVGMGLPLLHQASTRAGGDLKITSALGVFTLVTASFKLNNLNRVPLGDIAGTVINLILGTPDVHFYYSHRTEQGCFGFDSYWFYGRMAEQDCSLYSLVEPARAVIQQKLKAIQSLA